MPLRSICLGLRQMCPEEDAVKLFFIKRQKKKVSASISLAFKTHISHCIVQMLL